MAHSLTPRRADDKTVVFRIDFDFWELQTRK